MSIPSRVQPGVPTGGQFAAGQHAETEVDLVEQFPAPICKGQGRWEVSDTWKKEMPFADRVQRNKAAIALISEVDDHETTENKLRVLCGDGAQMTVLTADGSGSVEAKEVRGYPMADRLAVQRKGATRAAYALDSDAVLAVESGYGKQALLARHFHDRLAQVPQTQTS